MNRKRISTAILTIALCAAMTTPAHAATNPLSAMEMQSRQAVAATIKAGAMPPGTTIYDCVYGADKNGVTIVIEYRDKNGDWIDAITQKKKEEAITESISQKLDNLTLTPSAETPVGLIPAKLTDKELAAYTDKVFEIVNREREKTGAAPLERNGYLDEAANTRAMDCASVGSIRTNGQPHTRPDGSRWFTVLGIDENYNYGENSGQGRFTAEAQMKGWMDSAGHRANILNEDYTEIGIGCALSEQGEIFAIQIFYCP